ncbi:Phosphotransferase enzyme family protein [Paenibacillus sp. P1XP2]|nr:Phosphotransferase enzyme family protein [Paenibacillus sp. P1XP2]
MAVIAEGSAFHARSISTLANSRHRPPIRIEHDFLGADAANSGKLWILDRGRPFYVTAWIEGHPMQTAQDFEQLGQALAALHAIPPGKAGLKRAPALEQIRLWKTKDSFFRKTTARLHQKGRYRRWIETYGKACTSLSERAWSELATPGTLRLIKNEAARPSFVHNDVTMPNVILSGDGRLFLIDWDRIRLGSAFIDTAKAIQNTTQFNPEFIQSFLTGYEQHRPLGKAARKTIAALYALPLEVWSAFRFPSRAGSRQMLRTIDRTWQERVKAVEFMDAWAGLASGIPCPSNIHRKMGRLPRGESA